MYEPSTPEAIALTLRHDFGLLEGGERDAVMREARQIWEHHVKPLVEPVPDDDMCILMVRRKGTEQHWSGGRSGHWCTGSQGHVYSTLRYAQMPIKAMEGSSDRQDAEIVRYRLVEVEVLGSMVSEGGGG